MAQLQTLIGQISGYVWGWPTIILLMGTGIYLTILLRGMQFTALPHALALIFKKDKEGEGDISHFGALMTALAATVGIGNIVGVAGAILLGGPGAVFWMWMIALFGMATKYSEAILAVKYREQGPHGMRGGPMYYIGKGAGLPWLGVVFAIFASLAAFGIGNMTQANAVAANLKQTFGFNPAWVGAILTIMTGAVILGGIKSIARFTQVLVPVMIIGYIAGSLIVLAMNAARVPGALGMIFQYAFTPYAAGGGALGYVIGASMRYGIARGIFSNESGLGSSPIAAAAAITKDPATQALVSMTQTFIDTIVVCTLTALVILTGDAWTQDGIAKNVLTSAAFSQSLGRTGEILVTLATVTFAYSTLIGWSYYGEKSIEYLLGPKVITPYRILFILAINVGTIVELQWFQDHTDVRNGVNMIWDTADILNGLMAVPNLIGLLLLSAVIRSETVKYFNIRDGQNSS